ncbi:unnamed protein product [Prunus armeniaca]|uniref:Uncharacterized protein n=1 Tax=Prunus armeniaca TaxID=36596 RepID=A0A6J5TZG5_PRUAR|nr:unnamed protein product [Prunus armeniaca]
MGVVVLVQLMTSRTLTRVEMDVDNLEGSSPIATFEYLKANHDNPRNQKSKLKHFMDPSIKGQYASLASSSGTQEPDPLCWMF